MRRLTEQAGDILVLLGENVCSECVCLCVCLWEAGAGGRVKACFLLLHVSTNWFIPRAGWFLRSRGEAQTAEIQEPQVSREVASDDDRAASPRMTLSHQHWEHWVRRPGLTREGQGGAQATHRGCPHTSRSGGIRMVQAHHIYCTLCLLVCSALIVISVPPQISSIRSGSWGPQLYRILGQKKIQLSKGAFLKNKVHHDICMWLNYSGFPRKTVLSSCKGQLWEKFFINIDHWQFLHWTEKSFHK